MGSNAPGWIALGIAAATLLWTMFWSVFQGRRTTNPRLHAICGFAYFAQYSDLPDWLAWESFEQGNGNSTARSGHLQGCSS